MKAILHIGTEKTGTTSLQEFLFQNRRRLIDRGIGYAQSYENKNYRLLATIAMDGVDDHSQILHLDTPDARAELEAKVTRNLRTEIRRLAGQCAVIILSSEHLHSRLRKPGELGKLRHILQSVGVTTAKVVVYLRDPVQLAASLYSTYMRAGGEIGEVPGPNNEYWHHICDHKNTVVNWETAFPEAEVIPRLYDGDWLVNNDVIDDFCATLGIELNGLTKPERQNESISRTGQELLRTLNGRIPYLTADGLNPLRYNLVQLVEACYTGPTPPLERVLHKAYRDAFRDSNEYIRKRFFPHIPRLFDGQAAPESCVAAPRLLLEEALDVLAFSWSQHVREILILRKTNEGLRAKLKESRGARLRRIWEAVISKVGGGKATGKS